MLKPIVCAFLSAAFVAILLPAAAQPTGKIKIKNLVGCAYAGTLPKGVQVDLSALPTDEAQRYIDTTLLIGLHTGGDILLRAADSVKNAIATEINGKRYILYNPDFLRQFKQGGDARWIAYSVLAHEVGHHVSKHNFAETNCDRRNAMEWEADEYSGKVLRGLCAGRLQSLAALNALPPALATSKCYPSITLRKQIIGKAWSAQDSIFRAKPSIDPCVEKVTNVQLTYKVPESIPNTNPWAHVHDDRVEFTLDIPLAPKRNKVFTHLVVDERAGNLKGIKNFRWKDSPPFVPGPKKVVWYYKKDGLTRAQVEKLDLLSVCSFDKNPAPTPKKELFGWGTMAVGGAGLLTWGCVTLDQSLGLYKTYKQYKNPHAEQYQSPNASRSATKKKADDKLTQAAYIGFVGGTLLTWGVKKLWKRSQRNQRTFILIPNYPGNL